MILNVLIMAAADGGTVSMNALESPFLAPLRSLQWLDIYGSVSASPVHLQGLTQLIRMRGGLEMVQLPGLGAILSFFELINCSKTLSHPQFSFISLQGIDNPTLSEYFMFDAKSLKDRFVELYRVGCSEEYLAILQAMRVHLLVLDRYMRGLLPNPDLRQLSDRRNLIQHRLMSLRPTSGRDGVGVNLAEACRLSTIILSVGVIFPLSGHEAPFFTLANMLRAELESCGALAMLPERQYTTILIWILTLGGIAAKQTPSRAWFVDKLSSVPTTLPTRWMEVKTRLHSMLWLSGACDHAGERLWKEVELLKLSRLGRDESGVSQTNRLFH
ncbi:hypothetical protein TCE0_060r18818 [Talaromyces pinophilus]|uniref:Uncharacterized protein n=1 Tax=Talaromyces pinophilus TaxID=128442 RepID=A0A6V8HQY1_TALPI|nr:hypothetical protein TCE0_060r18818 [Talaromyces pinophilus]